MDTEMTLKANGNKGNRRNNAVHFLSHPGEPTDLYSSYLSQGAESADRFKNPRNLFADVNIEDRKWLKIAKRYLRLVGSVSSH